jgi:hypothetical protein
MSNVKTIFDAIQKKSASYSLLDNYYQGTQPTVYLTARLREIFRGVDISFVENWCSVVIDACDERINLVGFEASVPAVKKLLSAAWERNVIANEASDIHSDAMVTGECYAIAWPGKDGKAEVFYNSPFAVHAVYSSENPRQMVYAGKIFDGEDGKGRMTLYYPDRLEYYRVDKPLAKIEDSSAFVPDHDDFPEGMAPNPYNRVPVFHFRINRRIQSDLVNVIPLQNGINKLLSDMMVAAEYGAFRQRYVISNSDTSELKNAPNEVWSIPAGDGVGQQTAVGEFNATDLKNYLDAIDRLSLAIGVISRTPKHYFFTSTGDPSGEALIALEAPLNKKAQDRIDRFRPVWRDLGAFVCEIEGLMADPLTITPHFERPESIQPRTQAEITNIRVQSGVPLESALRWEGKTQAEIDEMQDDADEQTEKAQTGLGQALMDAERRIKEQNMPGQVLQDEQPNSMIQEGVNQNDRATNA